VFATAQEERPGNEVKFWRNAELEVHTACRLAEYERKTGRKVEPPVRVELLAEVCCRAFSYLRPSVRSPSWSS
jgi:hypothetical protein